jgi:iron-sulfur cluster repair protein YtfE (RIC family)
MEIQKHMTLNQITDAFPPSLKVLGDLGFDTCCGGWEAIGAAAVRKGIDWDKVVAALAPVVKGA